MGIGSGPAVESEEVNVVANAVMLICYIIYQDRVVVCFQITSLPISSLHPPCSVLTIGKDTTPAWKPGPLSFLKKQGTRK